MSCVAVKVYKDKIEIACDSSITQGDMILPSTFMKMEQFTLKNPYTNNSTDTYNIVAASAGTIEVIDAFFYYIANLDPNDYRYLDYRSDIRNLMEKFVKTLNDRERDFGPDNNEFILAINGKVYYIFATLVDEITTYRAIGSGCPYANTALLLGKSAKVAVKTATKMDTCTNGPIHVIELPKE